MKRLGVLMRNVKQSHSWTRYSCLSSIHTRDSLSSIFQSQSTGFHCSLFVDNLARQDDHTWLTQLHCFRNREFNDQDHSHDLELMDKWLQGNYSERILQQVLHENQSQLETKIPTAQDLVFDVVEFIKSDQYEKLEKNIPIEIVQHVIDKYTVNEFFQRSLEEFYPYLCNDERFLKNLIANHSVLMSELMYFILTILLNSKSPHVTQGIKRVLTPQLFHERILMDKHNDSEKYFTLILCLMALSTIPPLEKHNSPQLKVWTDAILLVLSLFEPIEKEEVDSLLRMSLRQAYADRFHSKGLIQMVLSEDFKKIPNEFIQSRLNPITFMWFIMNIIVHEAFEDNTPDMVDKPELIYKRMNDILNAQDSQTGNTLLHEIACNKNLSPLNQAIQSSLILSGTLLSEAIYEEDALHFVFKKKNAEGKSVFQCATLSLKMLGSLYPLLEFTPFFVIFALPLVLLLLVIGGVFVLVVLLLRLAMRSGLLRLLATKK